MRVLVAPDKFKGSLTAREVADSLCAGLQAGGVEATALPLADGGDGSVEAALTAGFRAVPVTVSGADRTPVRASFALDDAGTAVVEVATTSGLATLPPGELRPLTASSLGFGHAVRAAVEAGATRVVLALGGSASTDGGAGMLAALGVRFRDAAGRELAPCGGNLDAVAAVDLSGLLDLRSVELVVATDVDNPLLGASGAARVFGPQKGATSTEIDHLEVGLQHLVHVVPAPFGWRDARPGSGSDAAALALEFGSGAAGGLGFACRLLGAKRVSGADYFLDLLGFDHRVAGHEAVVTGEGRVDLQSLDGKLPSAVSRRAAGRPIYLVAGFNDLTPADVARLGALEVIAISDLTDRDPRDDADLSRTLLVNAGFDLARKLGAAAQVVDANGDRPGLVLPD